MASNQTTNYGLNQWEATDQVLRADFNADNSKIDAALKGLAEKGTALEEKDSLLENAISQCGNCRMEVVRFTGNGNTSFSVTFPQKPVYFMIIAGDAIIFGSGQSDYATILSYSTASRGAGISSENISWSGGRARITLWDELLVCFNKSGTTYYAMAFYQNEIS